MVAGMDGFAKEESRLRARIESGVLIWMGSSLGVYISVPFCRAKCTYCNFASGVFGAGPSGSARMDRYVERVCAEMRGARVAAERIGADLPGLVDTVFFGGGTPSLLSAEQMRRLFETLRGEFEVAAGAEVTLECAPGQLGEETLGEMLRQGMNRVSFGVQSFVDREAAGVGRLHTREMCLAEIRRMRSAGIEDINVDLIVGLPQQTAESWRESVEVALASGVPHLSVYMLEVDEDSRLGREMLASGVRYGAGDVASEDETAEWYGAACEWLESGGVRQYEISNFAREGHRAGVKRDHRSRHNVKYWRREPYVGFGLDAHSMLRSGDGAVRWANSDDLERFLGARYELRGMSYEGDGALVQLASEADRQVDIVGREQGFEEAMFLGLRMNDGVNLEELRAEFGEGLIGDAVAAMSDVEEAGLVVVENGRVRLTARGRMASNEVFSRLLVGAAV
jgi:oxygen-independent coproporphyrinogen-3 oxidase